MFKIIKNGRRTLATARALQPRALETALSQPAMGYVANWQTHQDLRPVS